MSVIDALKDMANELHAVMKPQTIIAAELDAIIQRVDPAWRKSAEELREESDKREARVRTLEADLKHARGEKIRHHETKRAAAQSADEIETVEAELDARDPLDEAEEAVSRARTHVDSLKAESPVGEGAHAGGAPTEG